MVEVLRNSEDILIFFGSHVKDRLTDTHFQQAFQDYVLLPLDVAAIGEVARLGIRYTVVDDWLEPGLFFQAREEASHLEKTWFEASKEAFTIENVYWPAFDRHAMHWFWQTFTLAAALAEGVWERTGARLRFFESSKQRPGLYYYPSDVCQPIWQALLGDRAWPLELPKCDGESRESTLRWLIRGLTKAHIAVHRLADHVSKQVEQARGDYRSVDYSELKDKIILAINPGEAQRFSLVVRQLKAAFPHRVAAVILTAQRQAANTISNEWGIPVACGPQPVTSPDTELATRFQLGVSQALRGIGRDSWRLALESLDFHFEYYCSQRWPALVGYLRFWTHLWRQVRPQVVLTSSLYDSESQLPAEAARRLDIPTFSIPHGGVIDAENLITSKYICYSLSTQRLALRRVGISEHCLTPCSGLLSENEYTDLVPIQASTHPGLWSVLVLAETIGRNGCLALSVRPGVQLATLKRLSYPPADISSQLCLRVKVHPDVPDLELFHAVGNGLVEKVLPVNTDLQLLLPQTDLVVALNYYGSALIHVLRAGKPVILFWTDTEAETYAYGGVFLPAGPVASTPEELWDLIRRFFTDPETAEQMRLRARDFCRNYLDDSNYPSIGEVVGRVLSQSK